jgi:hypothetical protein
MFFLLFGHESKAQKLVVKSKNSIQAPKKGTMKSKSPPTPKKVKPVLPKIEFIKEEKIDPIINQ